MVIASAREAIAKAQALLKDNEQILSLQKKKMEELKAQIEEKPRTKSVCFEITS